MHAEYRLEASLTPLIISNRLIGYLAFLWGNVVLGWAVLGGNLFLRGWWLLLLSAMTSISLVALTSTDPGRITASESGEQQLCPVARGRGHLAQVRRLYLSRASF